MQYNQSIFKCWFTTSQNKLKHCIDLVRAIFLTFNEFKTISYRNDETGNRNDNNWYYYDILFKLQCNQ